MTGPRPASDGFRGRISGKGESRRPDRNPQDRAESGLETRLGLLSAVDAGFNIAAGGSMDTGQVAGNPGTSLIWSPVSIPCSRLSSAGPQFPFAVKE